MTLRAKTRRLSRGQYSDLTLDEFGGLCVSQCLPQYTRLAAAGRLFSIDMHAGTAQAPKTAPVTTTAEWLLYNAHPTDTLFLIQASSFLKSGTLGLGMAMMAAAALGTQTAVTADYTGTIKTCLDGSKRIPEVYLSNNATLVGGTPSWVVLEGTKHNSLATDSVGDALVAWVDGMISAKPGGGIAFDMIGETGTTALFTNQFLFALLPLDTY